MKTRKIYMKYQTIDILFFIWIEKRKSINWHNSKYFGWVFVFFCFLYDTIYLGVFNNNMNILIISILVLLVLCNSWNVLKYNPHKNRGAKLDRGYNFIASTLQTKFKYSYVIHSSYCLSLIHIWRCRRRG